jgi:hypothetical protein
MTTQGKIKSLLQDLNPWAPLFAFVAMFQFVRGANFDAIYFSLVVIILLLDSWKGFPFSFPAKPKIGFLSAALFIATFGLLLYLVPRKSPVEVALMIGTFFIAIGLVWYKDSGPIPRATVAMTRSKWLWITIGVLVNLWELFSYVASDIAGDFKAYPTISVLMSPVMADPIGRVLFLVFWLLIGFFLIRNVTRSRP